MARHPAIKRGQRYQAMFHPDLARHPDSCPALVLNADYTPLSYYPLSLWPWPVSYTHLTLPTTERV